MQSISPTRQDRREKSGFRQSARPGCGPAAARNAETACDGKPLGNQLQSRPASSLGRARFARKNGHNSKTLFQAARKMPTTILRKIL